MKYTKGGFPFKSAPTKMHEGKAHEPIGEDENKDNFDDQSRDAVEDSTGASTNIIIPKVMNDGSSNRVISKDGVMNTEVPHQFRKPKKLINLSKSKQ